MASYIVGLDLCGPTNTQNTGVAVLSCDKGSTRYVQSDCAGSDVDILALISHLAEDRKVVVGIDAPLSYQPGGGDRKRDNALRRAVTERGMRPGSVMPPTLNKMAYLTLRGIAVARALGSFKSKHPVCVVEVHPGAALCFRGAPTQAIRDFASTDVARRTLIQWFGETEFDLPNEKVECSSHFVAACSAAVAARDWSLKSSKWLYRAEPPWHPYDMTV